MCKKAKKPNYYVAIGLLLSTGTYFLYDAHWISHEIRFISLVISIVIMIYGLFNQKDNHKIKDN